MSSSEGKNNKVVVAVAAIITVLVVIGGSFGGYMAYKSYYPDTQPGQLQETRAGAKSNPEGLLNAAATEPAKRDVKEPPKIRVKSPLKPSPDQQKEEHDSDYKQLSEDSTDTTTSSTTRTTAAPSTSKSIHNDDDPSSYTKQRRRPARGSTVALVILVLVFLSILLTAIGLIGYKLYTDKLERDRLQAEVQAAVERERGLERKLERQREMYENKIDTIRFHHHISRFDRF